MFHSKLKFLKRWAAVLSAVIVIAGLYSQPVLAAREAPGREIALVYDDSGSMVENNNGFSMNWCRAKYAMEAFAAMMKEKDRMSVFRMSQYATSEVGATDPIFLTGTMDADERVSIIHNMEDVCSNTYFNSVIAASNMLAEASNAYDKWLIVLTDGNFNNHSIDQVESYIKQSAQQNDFNVVYFVIGNTASSISPDEANGVYGYRAEDSQMILENIIEIANLVFKQQVLPTEYLRVSKNGLEITLDVPVSELIVFAQGKDIGIGELSLQEKAWICDELTNVKYCEILPGGDQYRNEAHLVLYDRSLEGVLATYRPDDMLPKGTYTLPVSDISNVQIYYTPSVEIALQMHDRKGNEYSLKSNVESIPSDQYIVTAELVDPMTGDAITSDLVQIQNCSIHIDNNGVQHTFEKIEQNEVEIYLNAGTLTGYASADLNEYQDVYSEFSCKVDLALREAMVHAELPKAYPKNPDSKFNYSLETLTDGTGILVSVEELSEATGQPMPLSRESWMNTEFDIHVGELTEYWESSAFEKMLYQQHEYFPREEKQTIDWIVERGENVGTFVIKPSIQGKPTDAYYGAVELEFHVTCPSDNYISSGAGNCTVYIAPMSLRHILPDLIMRLSILVVLLVLLVLFIRKKRLPRGLYAELVFENTVFGSFADKEVKKKRLQIKKHFSIFRPERATLTINATGIVSAPSLKLVAMTPGIGKKKRTFQITNLAEFETKSIAPVEVNNQTVEDCLKKMKKLGFSCSTTITCVANQYISSRSARCAIYFKQGPTGNVGSILSLLNMGEGKKKRKKHKKHKKK